MADDNLDLAYGTPFGDGFHIAATIQHLFAIEIRHPDATGDPYWFGAGVYFDLPLAALTANPVEPRLSLPLEPMINGHSALERLDNIGTTPDVSWRAPSIGKPDYYRLQVDRVFVDVDGHTRRTRIANLYTKQTSVRIPPDVLTPGSFYVLRIVGRIDGSEIETAPFRRTSATISASTVSGLVSP